MTPIYIQVPRLKQFTLSPPRDKHELVNYCQRSQIAKKTCVARLLPPILGT